ncbi:hypothetical protein [Citricoccus nitrophenolicus]|uniref:hypothetical protein n=1 Tax=Citricoccus nitrophenolicus TaxID=863575 RepID=UPI0031E859C8
MPGATETLDIEVGLRELIFRDGAGALGEAPGWTRVVDPGSEDALVFTAARVAPVAFPRVTLERHPWTRVWTGAWPDPTVPDGKHLDLAIEPFRRPDGEGWTVLRAASIHGRSLVERSWVFPEEDGLCLVRARFSPELFTDMERLLDSIVGSAPGIHPVGGTHVLDYGPAGTRAIPALVEIQPATARWLFEEAATDHPGVLAPRSDRTALAAAGIIDGEGLLTRQGRWLARTHVLSPRRWTLRAEHEAGSRRTVEISVTGPAAVVFVRSGTTQWIGTVHRSRAPEVAARFAGIGPAPHVNLQTVLGTETISARLADASTPAPPDADHELRNVWGDTWFRWILAAPDERPSPPEPEGEAGQPVTVRQFIGTLHNGHYALMADGPRSGTESRNVRLEAVPSTELFGMFCRTMLGVGGLSDQ